MGSLETYQIVLVSVGIAIAVIMVLYAVWKTWPMFRRGVAWVFRTEPRSIQEAQDQRDGLRVSDRARTGTFLGNQYELVADVREDLEEAMDDREELVTQQANAAVLAAADNTINTLQQALSQAEEVLRIRERRARRLYPKDFGWIRR